MAWDSILRGGLTPVPHISEGRHSYIHREILEQGPQEAEQTELQRTFSQDSQAPYVRKSEEAVCGNKTSSVKSNQRPGSPWGPGWESGSRTESSVKHNLTGEKVLLMDYVKISHKERKKQKRSDRRPLSIL